MGGEGTNSGLEYANRTVDFGEINGGDMFKYLIDNALLAHENSC